MNKIHLFLKLVLLLFILTPFASCRHSSDRKPWDPEQGYVPDEATAIKIAEAVWLPIYGEEIYDEKPFHARLENDNIWIVEGTFNSIGFGGVASARIQKKDGKILEVIHGK